MELSGQFWISILVQLLWGVALLSMIKQQLTDLIGWVKRVQMDVDKLKDGHTEHEGRLSHVEGRLGVIRGGEQAKCCTGSGKEMR